jgi:hypothetical protein
MVSTVKYPLSATFGQPVCLDPEKERFGENIRRIVNIRTFRTRGFSPWHIKIHRKGTENAEEKTFAVLCVSAARRVYTADEALNLKGE